MQPEYQNLPPHRAMRALSSILVISQKFFLVETIKNGLHRLPQLAGVIITHALQKRPDFKENNKTALPSPREKFRFLPLVSTIPLCIGCD